MTPKKAFLIILVLFFIVIAVFSFLYLKKLSGVPPDALINWRGSTGSPVEADKNTPSTPTEVIQQKIDKIIDQAEKDPTGNTAGEVRQEIISTINAEIIRQEQNKTPEQKAADLKAQEARQKIIDQINNQIKQETATK